MIKLNIAFTLCTIVTMATTACESPYSIGVIAGRTPPVSLQTPEDTLLQTTLKCDYRQTATNQLTFSVMSLPLHGHLTLVDAEHGQMTYLPDANYFGADAFSYNCQIKNSTVTPTLYATQITVTQVNDAPTADRATFQLRKESAGTYLDMDLTGSVTDVDNTPDQLTCKPDPTKLPTHGSLTPIAGKRCWLRYTPAATFTGTELMGYVVSDPAGAQATNVIDVVVGGNLTYIRPALAVRAPGCVLCHTAAIAGPNVLNANVITDFGFGNDWFWTASPGFNDWGMGVNGGSSPPTPATNAIGQSTNWGSTLITGGSVIIPKGARIPASAINATPAAGWSGVTFSLTDYLTRQASFDAPAGGSGSRFGIIEASAITIGAPTADAIRAGAAIWIPGTATLKYIKQNNAAPDLTGVRAVGSGASLYYVADASTPVKCAGDLVLDAPVWLNQAQIITGNLGCRIYSTASIFVSGTITVTPSAPTITDHNVQLASSRGIFMGLGPHDAYEDRDSGTPCAQYNVDSLRSRLAEDRFGNRMRIAADETQWNNFRTAVFSDEDRLAGLSGACGLPAYKEISFDRLLLNAPYVGGRYTKPFKGSIIAEVLTWLPGKFSFEFDPVFGRVPVLPILDFKSILQVSQ